MDYDAYFGSPAKSRSRQPAAPKSFDYDGYFSEPSAPEPATPSAQMKRAVDDDPSLLESVASFVKNAGSSLVAGTYSASAGAMGLLEALADTKFSQEYKQRTGRDAPLNAAITGFRKDIERTADSWRPKTDNAIEAAAYSGFESVPTSLTGAAMGLMGSPAAGLGFMGATSGGSSYSQARDAGVDQDLASVYGLSQGLIEVATEKLPVNQLIGDIANGTPFFRTLAKNLALEMPGEQVATLLQDLNEWAVINPDKPFASYLEARPSAALETAIATTVGVGAQVSISKGVQSAADRIAGRDTTVSPRPAVWDRQSDRPAARSGELVAPEVAAAGNDLVDDMDIASPLPTHVIAAGKATLAAALDPSPSVDTGSEATAAEAAAGATPMPEPVPQVPASTRPEGAEPLFSESGEEIGWFDRATGATGRNEPVAEIAPVEPALPQVEASLPQVTASAGKLLPVSTGDGTRAAPLVVRDGADLDAVAPEITNTEPTDGQKEAGNYAKGHVRFAGLDVTIENPRGSTRSGMASDGSSWSVEMPAHYGYVKRTEGADGDHFDVYLGPNPDAGTVYVVDQVDADSRAFDEHKAMVGFDSEAEALAAYDAGYSDGRGPARRGAVTAMPVEAFRDYLKGDTTKPLALPGATERLNEGGSVAAAASTAAAPAKPNPVAALRDYVDRRRGALNPAAIGKALGITPAQARKAMSQLAAQPDSGLLVDKAGNLRRRAQRKGPVDVNTFLADRGGIADDEGHDLAKGRGLQRLVPGAGSLIRPGGMSIDRAGELLHEAGYFPGSERPSTAQVLDLLERAGRQKVYRPDDTGAVLDRAEAARAAEDADDGGEEAYRQQVREIGRLNGFPMARSDVDAIVSLTLGSDLDVSEALFLHFGNEDLAAADDAFYETGDPYYDDPVGEDWLDATEVQDTDRRGDDAPVQDRAGRSPDARNPEQGEAGASRADGADEERRDHGEGPQADRGSGGRGQGDGLDLLGGATRDEQRQALERRGEGRQSNEAEQKPAGSDGGLFDTEARNERQLFDEPRAAPAPPPPPAPSPSPGDRIEDFGEKLLGARKDASTSLRERLSDDVELANVPLSKSWPEPDYQKLLDEGADPYTVAFIRAARDSIPTKPQKAWKLRGWVESVSAFRQFSLDLLSGDLTPAAVQDVLNRHENRRLLNQLDERMGLYEAVGHTQSLKGFRLSSASYSVFAGQRYSPAKVFWSVEKDAKATGFGNWPRQIAVGETKAEAIAKFKARLAEGVTQEPAKREVTFSIWGRAGKFHVGKKVGKAYVSLRAFETVADARQYLRDNRESLIAELEARRVVPDVRRATNAPRIGIDHRNGGDVTPEQFAEAFGFRGVQFGNYVGGPRRQQDLNEAFDALMDMAGVLDVPPRALSLNGDLGLAFGARGKGGKNAGKAHYEAGHVVINLTKGSGAGSLAHEWWHALDNYFSRRAGRRDAFMTSTVNGPDAGNRQEMIDAFNKVRSTLRTTELRQRSLKMDAMRSKPYWSTDLEMSARAFEAYVIARLADQNQGNDYLANIVSEEAFSLEGGYPYPTAGEIASVREAYDGLFTAIESRETNRGVELFQLSDEPVARLTGDELGSTADFRALRDAAIGWYRSNLLGTTATMADGRVVQFNRAGVRKSTSRKGEDLLRAVPAIRAIIENGAVVEEVPGDADHPAVLRNIVIAAPIEIDGRIEHIAVSVHETHEGKFHYNLTFDRDAGARSSKGSGGRTPEGERYLQEGARGEFNIFKLPVTFNSASGGALPAALADLSGQLKLLGLEGRVGLRLVDVVRAAEDGRAVPEAEGAYARDLIQVAMSSRDRRFTLDHESVHAMRELGLFQPAEWRALERAARADAGRLAEIRQRYRGAGLAEDGLVEEAIADMFAEHQAGQRAKGMVGRAFDRIIAVLTAIRAAFGGAGFESADDVFKAMDAGIIGARDGSPTAEGTRYSLARGAVETEPSTIEAIEREAVRLFEGLKPGSPLRQQAGDAFDRWRTAAQDRFLPLLRTQQRIERTLGRTLSEAENPYLGEELMAGRIGAQLETLADEKVAPLFEAMQDEGVTVAELESYLYARHAPERNARIAAINPKFRDKAGSGMTDVEAAQIMEAAKAEGKLPGLERLAAKVDDILAFALDTRVAGGLLSEADADIWRQQYQHYVPLRGRAELDPEASADRPHVGSGVNVRGAESKRAFGRESKAEDVLAYAVMQAQEAIVRAETNQVAQRFHDLAKAAPDERFWTVDKVTRRAVWNEAKGQVEYRSENRLLAEDAPYTVSLKIDGVEHRVTLNRENPAAARLADAMRNLTAQQMNWVVKTMGSINRYLSMVNTSLNPEFVVTNAFRDIQTAGINLGQYDVPGLIAGTMRDYRQALAGSMRGAFKADKGEWGRWYREFVSEGGRVYFNQVEDVGALRDRIGREFARAGGNGPPLMKLKAVFEFIEKANTGVENAIRLSAYKNARERGMSKQAAASLAKNLTVNFNRRGTYGPLMNSMYLFFNASVQGSAVLLSAMKSRRVQKVLGAAVLTGALLDILNAMLSDDDDDGESFYAKIPAFDKSRNLILMIPGGKGEHIKIPLPYGYNAFFAMGRSAVELARGASPAETMGDLLTTIVDAFNPIGGSESLLNLIAPTIADPIVDLTRNRDYADRPIMPEQSQFGPEVPDAQRYWGSVGPHWKAITDFLTEVTGGDDVRPGAIDVSPETLEHLFGVVTGAAGAFFDRNVGLAQKLFDPEAELGIGDVPVIRKAVGGKPGWYDKAAFYERLDEIEQAKAYAKGYADKGDDAGYATLMRENSALLDLEGIAKESRKAMSAVRKQKAYLSMAREKGEVEPGEYRAASDELRTAEKEIINEFNAGYNQAVRR